jgi:hypothetical protein
MASKIQYVHNWWCSFNCSVADPDPIHRIHMCLGLLDPDPDLDPSNIKQKCFVTSFYRILRNYDVTTS